MKKRLLALTLALTMGVGLLSGCGGSGSSETTSTPTVAPTTATTDDGTTTGNDGENDVSSGTDGSTALSGEVRTDMTALELSVLMGNGINLGNTLEATGGETAWGQPTTTQEMITEMKNGGFDSIRIPVGWTNAMPDYQKGLLYGTEYEEEGTEDVAQEEYFVIADYYLDRVEEIINYALQADMYVVINDHWDRGWWAYFGFDDETVRENAMKMYVSMWTQIAERYAAYGDYVIFEGGNEELGSRLNDEVSLPDGTKQSGTLSESEYYAKACEINQTFVDTVRATGGNNAERFLLIPGINTDIESTCDSKFSMPTDTAENKLLLSVHYYTPWSFCGEAGLDSWGSVTNLEEMNSLFASISQFVDEGYGVIIGEYAVLAQKGSFKSDTALFYENLLDLCDYYNMVPMLWDCSNLFKRSELTWTDDEVASVFTNRKAVTDDETTKAATAEANIQARLEAAQDKVNENLVTTDESASVAWIMYNSKDYNITASVGDDYTPENISSGVKATDVLIEGEGTYTVGLDFSEAGGARGIAFMAIGISNGEINFPGYSIEVTDIKVDGESVEFEAGYTTSDDDITTRINIYNEWVPSSQWPDGGTTVMVDAGADAFSKMSSIEITFTYSAN
jgi:endoglucanase